jgi:hypothetical protein
VFSLLIFSGPASARGGHGGGGHGGGGHGGGGHAFGGGGYAFHGGSRWAGRPYAWGGAYVRPYYGYYGLYPYPVWVPGYWTESCTPEYCAPVWVPGYWQRW